jgi:hypothetical protein
MLHNGCGLAIGDLNTIVESHSIIIPYTIPAGVYRKKPKILPGKKPMETLFDFFFQFLGIYLK